MTVTFNGNLHVQTIAFVVVEQGVYILEVNAEVFVCDDLFSVYLYLQMSTHILYACLVITTFPFIFRLVGA